MKSENAKSKGPISSKVKTSLPLPQGASHFPQHSTSFRCPCWYSILYYSISPLPCKCLFPVYLLDEMVMLKEGIITSF